MEHIFSIESLLDNARTTVLRIPLSCHFLTCKMPLGQYVINTSLIFCSTSSYLLQLCYITSCYFKLTAYVSTKAWKTTAFSMYQGVFQGNTLSPLLFNLAIDPLLAYLSTSEDCGYSAQPQAANSIGLPPVDIPIYVLWTDFTDDAPTGWYRAIVTSYHCDGSCDLAYDNGDSEQSLNLHTTEWCYAGKYRKVLHPDKTFHCTISFY